MTYKSFIRKCEAMDVHVVSIEILPCFTVDGNNLDFKPVFLYIADHKFCSRGF